MNNTLPLLKDDINSLTERELNPKTILYFLQDNQTVVRYREPKGELVTKYVSPLDLKLIFKDETIDSNWLPTIEGIVRHGYGAKGTWYMYWRKAHVRTMMVADSKISENEKMVKITVPMPASLLVCKGFVYSIYAAGTDTFSSDVKLYRMPCANVYDDHGICWGGNNLPERTLQNAQKVWDLFFESPFTGGASNGKSRKFNQDINEMLLHVAKSKLKKWPITDMIEAGATPEFLYERIRQ